jgi:lipid-binding SYLF domain-containing protein
MRRLLIILLICLPLAAYANPDKERKEAQQMREKVLAKLYKEKPGSKAEIANAKGYGVFSNIGINLFLVSTARGGGIVHDNSSGKDTYMKMFSAGGGIGLGVKDFSVVFVFNTADALNNFIESGWDFSGQADANLESEDKGGGTEAAATVIPGVQIYQMTDAGIALQATLQGTKYWKDDDLN